MHRFTDLIARCTTMTLNALSGANREVLQALETSGATRHVKALQTIELQRVIFAVGIFSIFEAHLQDALACRDGFAEARRILDAAGEADLRDRFEQVYLATNVLKHGKGQSYEKLVAMAPNLPFRVMLPNEGFFEEGDVSEVTSLVLIDDAFVQHCATVIFEVARVVERVRDVAL